LQNLKKRLGYETTDLLPLGAVRKNVIKDVGFINSSFGMYDDWEFAKRVAKKYKIVRIKSAKFYHKEPDKLQKIYRQCKWTAKSTVFLFIKKEYFKFLRNCVFIFLNAFLPVYILFLFLPLFFKIVGVIGLLSFSILELYRSLKMYKITKWWVSFITPIYDSFYMLLVVLGFLEVIIKNELNFGV